MPARKSTFSKSGRRATCAGSRRSQERGSTPEAWRSGTSAGSVKRATAATRRGDPAASAARRTSRAREGPIFPPAPRTATSPGRLRRSSMSAGEGRERSSSSCASFSTTGGNAAVPDPATRGSVMTRSFSAAAGKQRNGAWPRAGSHAPSTRLERSSQPYSEDSPGCEPFYVCYRVRPQDPGTAVVRVAVHEEAVELGEAGAVSGEELRVVEGVVEQGRELELEPRLGDDVLVEREVHDPVPGPEPLSLLAVAGRP